MSKKATYTDTLFSEEPPKDENKWYFSKDGVNPGVLYCTVMDNVWMFESSMQRNYRLPATEIKELIYLKPTEE